MVSEVSHAKGLLALSPIAVFLVVYLVSSIIAGDFYRVPVSSAFLLACVYALTVSKGTMEERLKVFSDGAAHNRILLMVWIFVLAGAFAGTAKDMGAIDATVNATLMIVPSKMLFAGMFLTSCFISMSIGTSVGTIVALVPIASGIAGQSGSSYPFMAAVVVGGALFGDNLSFISDTTIAATKAMECEMGDKFKVNIRIVMPAVLIVTLIYVILGQQLVAEMETSPLQPLKVIPYITVIILAVCGLDVLKILFLGIVMNAAIGLLCGDFTWVSWLESLGRGIAGMSDLIVISMLAGGLMWTIRNNGGMDYIIQLLTRHISGRRGAQFSIAGLVCLANLCTANNTIAIITVGDISKDITDRFGLDPRKTASILDTFSCFIQGIIPYGVQILMASSLAYCSPGELLPYLYYPFVMGSCAVLAIIFRYPRRYSPR
ncbi:MAG: Na+/H+ antiporter NhaC family protein [Bacteroidaceae bacterium]|nr:Na+/H+ antiporter NhaC family protein [Bacteroidaceae bacterium]